MNLEGEIFQRIAFWESNDGGLGECSAPSPPEQLLMKYYCNNELLLSQLLTEFPCPFSAKLECPLLNIIVH